MKIITVLIITFLFLNNICGQTVPPEYYKLTKKADSLYRTKDYNASAFKYSDAFKLLGGKGLANDRYDAACSWALAGYPDSAIFNLERIAHRAFYSDYQRVTKDKDLVSLYNHRQWKPLLEKIKHNQDSIEAKMDRKLIARLDSLASADQKWRNLATKQGNGEKLKDSIDPKTIFPNMILTDNSNLVEVRKIFYTYGFPNYDLVGTRGSSNFWLLVQHQDRSPAFQDSVLVLMKIEAEKGKASWNNYAYLIDRVKVNAGEKQIYGTQMQMNNDNTSFEPKPVIEPEKLNERRKSVGLGTIEEYADVMNSRYHGGLKKK